MNVVAEVMIPSAAEQKVNDKNRDGRQKSDHSGISPQHVVACTVDGIYLC